ncbi:MAG: cyclic nucleotide-binding domain-containing protein [Opitutaceae bacterium]
MDFNLILTAQTLVLAPHVRESVTVEGTLVLKNIPAKTYLHVSKAQWILLQQFRQPRTVPVVLGHALDERLCLPLHEFYELILKAVRANILLEPNASTPEVKSTSWRATARSPTVPRFLFILFVAGMVTTLVFRPELPTIWVDALAGGALLSVALSLGSLVAASVSRGAGGEVYRPRWQWLALPPQFTFDGSDTVMLAPLAQVTIALARPAMVAALTGLLAWHLPTWNLFPLIGLLVTLRPALGGNISTLFGLERGPRLSDAEREFVFPPNLRPRARWKLFVATISQPETWMKLGYASVWAAAFIYLAARLFDVPVWKLEFWKASGPHIAFNIGGSLVVLTLAYLAWELTQFLRTRARHRRQRIRLWHTRWFGGRKFALDEAARIKLAAASPLLRTVPAPQRQAIARQMEPVHHKAFTWLPEYSDSPAKAALVVSGTLGLYRVLPSGRTTRVNVLAEGDVVGLQDLADPARPAYRVRSLTPVTLLSVERTALEKDLIKPTPKGTLTNIVIKRPFLRQIGLCRTWHLQAVERFAQLSTIVDCDPEGSIVQEGSSSQHFFIIFEHEASVTRNGKRVGIVYPGEFFGEIGLLQNSSATAGISARQGTRCLSISRNDFLRFVTHNHLVALELERVSSQRLGRPIFPLKAGNFRTM